VGVAHCGGMAARIGRGWLEALAVAGTLACTKSAPDDAVAQDVQPAEPATAVEPAATPEDSARVQGDAQPTTIEAPLDGEPMADEPIADEPELTPPKVAQAPPLPAVSEQPTIAVADASALAALPATLEPSLAVDRPDLQKWFALDARAGVPKWGVARTAAADLARDDDILTGWRCDPKLGRCALALTFPEPVELAAVRIFLGIVEHGGQEPTTLRLHTDAGHADVRGFDVADHHQTIVLASAVATEHLAVELVGAKGKAAFVAVGEVEAFGVAGTPREPLHLDPTTAHVLSGEAAWQEGATKRLKTAACLRTIGSDGVARCFLRATALHGDPGDRFLLAEFMTSVPDCEATGRGAYLLVDRTTRRVMNIGKFRALPGAAFRHKEGVGWSVVDGADLERIGETERVAAVTVRLESGEIVRKTDRIDAYDRLVLGFESAPRPRGGVAVTMTSAPPTSAFMSGALPDCRAMDGDSVSELRDALHDAGHETADLDAVLAKTEGGRYAIEGMWICRLPGDVKLVTNVADATAALMTYRQNEDYTAADRAIHDLVVLAPDVGGFIRMRGAAATGLMLELAKNDQPWTDVYRVDAKGAMTRIAQTSALAVRDCAMPNAPFDEPIDQMLIPRIHAGPPSKEIEALRGQPEAVATLIRRRLPEEHIAAISTIEIRDTNGDGVDDVELRIDVPSDEPDTPQIGTVTIESRPGGGYTAKEPTDALEYNGLLE
jgi:hypothetical protein